VFERIAHTADVRFYVTAHNLEGLFIMTIDLDEALLEEAQRMTGIHEPAALIHEGLRVLIAREARRRLARLGGSDPRAQAPRRRP